MYIYIYMSVCVCACLFIYHKSQAPETVSNTAVNLILSARWSSTYSAHYITAKLCDPHRESVCYIDGPQLLWCWGLNINISGQLSKYNGCWWSHSCVKDHHQPFHSICTKMGRYLRGIGISTTCAISTLNYKFGRLKGERRDTIMLENVYHVTSLLPFGVPLWAKMFVNHLNVLQLKIRCDFSL